MPSPDNISQQLPESVKKTPLSELLPLDSAANVDYGAYDIEQLSCKQTQLASVVVQVSKGLKARNALIALDTKLKAKKSTRRNAAQSALFFKLISDARYSTSSTVNLKDISYVALVQVLEHLHFQSLTELGASKSCLDEAISLLDPLPVNDEFAMKYAGSLEGDLLEQFLKERTNYQKSIPPTTKPKDSKKRNFADVDQAASSQRPLHLHSSDRHDLRRNIPAQVVTQASVPLTASTNASSQEWIERTEWQMQQQQNLGLHRQQSGTQPEMAGVEAVRTDGPQPQVLQQDHCVSGQVAHMSEAQPIATGLNGLHGELGSRDPRPKTPPRPSRPDGRNYVAHIPMRLLSQSLTSNVPKCSTLTVEIFNECATIIIDGAWFQCDKLSSSQLLEGILGHVLRLVAMQPLEEKAHIWYGHDWVPLPYAELNGVNVTLSDKMFIELLIQCGRRVNK